MKLFEDIKGTVFESVSCPNGCQPEDNKVLFYAHERLFGSRGEFRIVRCSNCGLVRTNLRPTLDTIGLYYLARKYCA